MPAHPVNRRNIQLSNERQQCQIGARCSFHSPPRAKRAPGVPRLAKSVWPSRPYSVSSRSLTQLRQRGTVLRRSCRI
jgi:hypothetical protein